MYDTVAAFSDAVLQHPLTHSNVNPNTNCNCVKEIHAPMCLSANCSP